MRSDVQLDLMPKLRDILMLKGTVSCLHLPFLHTHPPLTCTRMNETFHYSQEVCREKESEERLQDAVSFSEVFILGGKLIERDSP